MVRRAGQQQPKPAPVPETTPEEVPPVAAGPGRARDVAFEELLQRREVRAGWEEQLTQARREFDALEAKAGEAVLDDPKAATEVLRNLDRLRDWVSVAQRAVEASGPRVADAERAYLLAEAAVLDEAADELRLVLAAHEQRTRELLEQLREHEGPFVAQPQAFLRSAGLRARITHAEFAAEILRTMARGEDPEPALQARASVIDGTVAGVAIEKLYPDCVRGPDAVVPAPAFMRSLEVERLVEQVCQRRDA
jgi:hypothetical protein